MAETARARVAPEGKASTAVKRKSARSAPQASARPTLKVGVEAKGPKARAAPHQPAERVEASGAVDELAPVVEAFGASVGQTVQSLAALKMPFAALENIQADYVQQASELWNACVEATGLPARLADNRFAAPDWQGNSWSRFLSGLYVINSRALSRLAESLQGDEKSRQRVRFAVQQWNAAASPANFLALNPEAQRKALETGGKSLEAGLELLLRDLRQGHVSQTDESLFEVGVNVATTAGHVVYENQLFQLIEYSPLTDQVYERPLLVVPPCINKFYILDLQPENSLVRYAVSQGHRVFVVSWVNPGEELSRLAWDDYVEDGLIQAIHTVQAISRQPQIDTLGFCIGGTLLATALAVLDARGEQPSASLTLLASFLDFSHTGIMDVFVDEPMVQWREVTLGEQSPNGGAMMKGRDLGTTFSFLRPTDLVWNYVVGNYLKGEAPPAFDLLYWNSDSTNLPGPMYCWYLRHTYLQNDLKVPNKLRVCGQPLDLSRLSMPAFVLATREDHIVPWQSAYGSMNILSGERRFVLGASGHIAGIINPPSKNKRSYWMHDDAPDPMTGEQWLASATEHPGSWWTPWSTWLSHHAGKLVAAPIRAGDAQHPVIEPAPGRYVKRRL